MEKITGEHFLQLLSEYSEQKNKIFIPSSHDEKLSETVVKYFQRNYDYAIMVKCIKRYLVRSKEVGVSLDDFVKKLTYICDDVVSEAKIEKETRELLEQTKKRMEGYNKNEL